VLLVIPYCILCTQWLPWLLHSALFTFTFGGDLGAILSEACPILHSIYTIDIVPSLPDYPFPATVEPLLKDSPN